MGSAAAEGDGEGPRKGEGIGYIGFAKSFIAVLIVAQVALTAGLYFQTVELKMSEDEKQAQIGSLRGQIDALHEFFESEISKLSRSSCPPCPSLHEKMETALRDVHRDFETTAEKLNATVESLHATISVNARKIATLAEKAQNSPLLKLLQNM